MSTIEERVVSIQFKGDQFLSAVDKSLQKLDTLTNKLKMAEGTKGLDNLGAAAGRQHNALNALAQGVQHIADRFKVLGVVAASALSNITNQAIFAGQNLAKLLTIGPILDGFHEFETNMNSVQTILANTQAAGTKLSDVTAVLDDLNHYSDQTIYNFAEMAKNIGTFTAAGVGLKPAAAAIKGIANLAALSGSNSEQASGAMYQLSQAISSGRVSLEDWNSVVNAGMGGTVFQRALALNAEKMGTLSKGAVKLKGDMKNVTIEGKSFRDSISAKPGKESWLTSKVLTQTLAQFTGDLSNAQLAAEGFNDAEIKAIQAQAKTAREAATQVKTVTQLIGTLKESVGSGWAQTWKIIFGDFNEAKGLFTGVSKALGKIVSDSAEARNKMLSDWSKAGGRAALIDTISNSFQALLSILKPIRQAWAQAFPAKSGSQLAEITKTIAKFTAGLKLGSTTANNLKRTFQGVFAVLGIGYDIVKGAVGLIARLTGVVFDGSGGFLDFTARVGDFLVNLRQAIKEGKGIENFFKGLGTYLEIPIRAIKLFGDALSAAFGKISGGAIVDNVRQISEKMGPMADQAQKVATGWKKVEATLVGIGKKISAIADWIITKFAGVGEFIVNMFTGLNFSDITKGINTGLFATLIVMIKQWMSGAGGGGVLDSITEAIEGLTGTLQGMQNALNAGALLGIAAAIGVLAIALNVLAKIDADGLTRGSVAMASIFTQLSAAVIVLQKFSSFTGVAKLPFVAGAMLILAASVAILAYAMDKMSVLSWDEIVHGLVGMTGILAQLVVVAQLMPKGKSFVLAAAGLAIMAIGLGAIADAVGTLGQMSWEDMVRGLVGVGVLMGALLAFANSTKLNIKGFVSGIVVLFMAKAIQILADAVKQVSDIGWEQMAKGLTITAVGLALIAAALRNLGPKSLLSAGAVLIAATALEIIMDVFQKGANMNGEQIAKGIGVMAGSLAILAGALGLMTKSLPGAAALAIAAVSMQLLADAFAANADLSWEQIAKGMAVMAGSLILLTIALYAMSNPAVAAGTGALIVASAALVLIAGAMALLGTLSWSQLIIALTALAGVFIIIGLAGLILAPIVPAIYALAGAIALVGVAMLAAGAGVALFGLGILLLATGLAALAVSGVAGTTAILGMISVLLGGIPMIITFLGKLLTALLDLVIKLAPKLGQAFGALLDMILDVIDKYAPKIISVMLRLLLNLLNAVAKYAEPMADAGARLVVGILNGLSKNVGKMADAATKLITKFIDAIGRNVPKVVDAGAKMVIKLVNGIADAIRSNSTAMGQAGGNLATAIIQGMVNGLRGGAGAIISAAASVAKSALTSAMNVLGIHSPSKEFEKLGMYVVQGFRKGIDGNKEQIDSAFNDLSSKVSAMYKNAGDDIVSLTKKLHRLESARKKDVQAIKETKAALAEANKEKAGSLAALKYMKTLKDEHAALDKLAAKYDVLSEKIKTAQDVYVDAVKTRDDYNKSISDQYGNALDPTGDMTASDYITDLKKQLEDTVKFANEIQQLRQLGINDETYKDLLNAGSSALPFIDDLLRGGQDQIQQINELNKQLDAVSASMGKTASSTLYQAAVDSAAGIVKGLQDQQAAIEKQMDKIADAMVRAIKKKLGIKSPSRVFAEVGEYSAEGVKVGLEKSSGVVSSAATAVGAQAVAALKASLSGVDKMVAGNIDLQPTIRPVLDLTDIQKNASKLGGLLPADNKMSVDGTYTAASSVATAFGDRRDGGDDGSGTAGGVNLNYTQNNYSPKAISPVETYRNTKNQLSTVKGALEP